MKFEVLAEKKKGERTFYFFKYGRVFSSPGGGPQGVIKCFLSAITLESLQGKALQLKRQGFNGKCRLEEESESGNDTPTLKTMQTKSCMNRDASALCERLSVSRRNEEHWLWVANSCLMGTRQTVQAVEELFIGIFRSTR